MATKRTYTITPIIGGKGFKVNYTVAGFSPDSPDRVEHKEFRTEKDVQTFVEKLQKGGWKAY